jgi:CHRD domain-containing protein
MCRSVLARAILAAAVTTASAAYANAQEFNAKFSGFNELGALNNETGAIFSTGQATLTLNLNRQQQSLTYSLTYSNLVSPVTQAHIHFGKIHVPGGIMVFLCTNLGNGPPGTPGCPASGTVTGMLTQSSVIGPAAQNIKPGDFDALAAALLSDTAYGNIHSVRFPAGEIRGQIRRPENEDQQR